MCDLCGCGFGSARVRLAGANDVPVTLAAIPVKIVAPSAAGERPQPQRQQGIRDSLLQRAPRSP